MATLRIELVGGIRARTGDGREIRITGRKCQALLGCLALRPGMAATREFLASLLWEDADSELARLSLRQALARLRRELSSSCEQALQADAQSVWLDADTVTSDVAEFRAQLHDAAPGSLLATIDRCGEEVAVRHRCAFDVVRTLGAGAASLVAPANGRRTGTRGGAMRRRGGS